MASKRNLPEKFRKEAEELAMRPYSVVVHRDVKENGEPYFWAVNQELDGCIAHGNTSEEAIENLKEARTDFIQILLIDGSPVPYPFTPVVDNYTGVTGTAVETTKYVKHSDTELLYFDEDKDEYVFEKYSLRLQISNV